MLLRISLILAILAGVAVIVLTQFKVRPQMQEIIETRDYNKEQWDKETRRANKLQSDLKKTTAELETTKAELDQTKTELTAATAKANEQERRANGLQDELTKTKTTLRETQQSLAAWNALGIPVEKIREMMAELEQVKALNFVLNEEKRILHRNNTQLQTELDLLRGKITEVPLPEGLKGNVVVVDPKWDFVVLDIGSDEGVLKDGVMMVSRNGQLVAKVRITSVQPHRSVANVVPGWKLGDIMEGDKVLY